jgi:hypothetical protein
MSAPQAQPANARPWRKWARDNHVGLNFTQNAIAARKLRVRRVGKRILVLDEDGLAFLRSLPEGPGPRPANFEKNAT